MQAHRANSTRPALEKQRACIQIEELSTVSFARRNECAKRMRPGGGELFHTEGFLYLVCQESQ